MQEIKMYNSVLTSMIEDTISEFTRLNPEVEIHEVRIYGSYSQVSKKVEIAIKTDVREPGQMLLGASS